MSAPSSTQGPWSIAPRDTNRRVVDASGHSVAVASPLGNDRKDEAFANARLIAAAPDMLAALRAMVALLPHTDDADVEAVVQAARAAIAKAEGA